MGWTSIEVLDGSWGGDPEHKAKLSVRECAGDGDAVELEIVIEEWEDESEILVSILMKCEQAGQMIRAVDEKVVATLEASTVEGFGNDGLSRQMKVDRAEVESGLVWLWMSAPDTEGGECRFGLGFGGEQVAEICSNLAGALEVADRGESEEWVTEASAGSHVVKVTGGWLRIRVSDVQLRRVSLTLSVMTANGNPLALEGWLRLADAERLMGQLSEAAPAPAPAPAERG